MTRRRDVAKRRGMTPVQIEAMHFLPTSSPDSMSSPGVSVAHRQSSFKAGVTRDETDLLSIIELFPHMPDDTNLLIRVSMTQ